MSKNCEIHQTQYVPCIEEFPGSDKVANFGEDPGIIAWKCQPCERSVLDKILQEVSFIVEIQDFNGDKTTSKLTRVGSFCMEVTLPNCSVVYLVNPLTTLPNLYSSYVR